MPASVLIVDHPPDLDRLCAIVGAEEYDVERATSTAAATALLKRRPFDLVLSELRSRDIDGWDIVKATKRHAPDAHIVFLLGSVNDETEDILRRLDIDGHLLKPVDRVRLRATLKALLEPTGLDRTTEAYLYLPRDEPRHIIEPALTQAGIFSRTFEDARVVTVESKNDPPNLLIVDIGPGSADGFTVCAEIRELRHYIPILAISEYVTRDDVQRAVKLHVNDLILEPVQGSDLRDSALRLLRHTKSSRRPGVTTGKVRSL